MSIVDGKKLANQITEEVIGMVNEKPIPPRLVVITCNPNFETQKFLALKKTKAESLGVVMETIFLSLETDTQKIIEIIKSQATEVDGVIVQLPLPNHIDTDAVLASIPSDLDVDVFGYKGEDTDILPPVIGAISEIAKHYKIAWEGKEVVVFGSGRLVGTPAILFARAMGANVNLITEHNTEVLSLTKKADIIILGVGKPNLLTSEMIKDGVIIFDAGASEDGGLLVGDASLSVAERASLITPVPGGIGPMTVILLFRNLLKLCSRQ